MAGQVETKGISTAHDEQQLPPTTSKWLGKSRDGDVALALFNDPHELDEPITPELEKKLVRKIDFLILPLIAVN
jgi:hypothetical protein